MDIAGISLQNGRIRSAFFNNNIGTFRAPVFIHPDFFNERIQRSCVKHVVGINVVQENSRRSADNSGLYDLGIHVPHCSLIIAVGKSQIPEVKIKIRELAELTDQPFRKGIVAFKHGPFSLVFEQELLRLKKHFLVAGGICCQRGGDSLFMEAERKVPVYQPDINAVLPLIFDQAETRVRAVRALEVRVLNDRQHGIFRTDAPVQF